MQRWEYNLCIIINSTIVAGAAHHCGRKVSQSWALFCVKCDHMTDWATHGVGEPDFYASRRPVSLTDLRGHVVSSQRKLWIRNSQGPIVRQINYGAINVVFMARHDTPSASEKPVGDSFTCPSLTQPNFSFRCWF